MDIPLYQVDAFADRPFGGNPAAVCLLPAARDAGWMQAVASEMNLSETAFLTARSATDSLASKNAEFDLRWFTPAAEVDLCGHATLAAAHVLWETESVPPSQAIDFHTRSGVLSAAPSGEWIELDFPADPGEEELPSPEIAAALGKPLLSFERTGLYFLAELESESAVCDLAPDFRRLAAVVPVGIITTATSDSSRFDFVSRFFAPAVGIDEDPVTGSAHCSLGPFWGERLGKRTLIARQASARGGVVRVRLKGERVVLGGQAVTVLRGKLV